MVEAADELNDPDLTRGVELSAIADVGTLLRHARAEAVLLARGGDNAFAIGAICAHCAAPLEQGLLAGYTIHRDLAGLRTEEEFEHAMAHRKRLQRRAGS